jgi:hypothetical protein
MSLEPGVSARGSRGAHVGDHEYCRLMEDVDRDVLEFTGDQGKTAEQVADRFPAFEGAELRCGSQVGGGSAGTGRNR